MATFKESLSVILVSLKFFEFADMLRGVSQELQGRETHPQSHSSVLGTEGTQWGAFFPCTGKMPHSCNYKAMFDITSVTIF